MTDSNQDLVIIELDRAKQALAEAKTIQQTKKILDVARAVEIYAKRQQLSQDAIAYAHDVKLEALRLLGRLLREMPKATGGDAQRTRFKKGTESPATLSDLGIDKKTSMIAQQLAGLPQAQFEQIRDGIASMAQVLRAVKGATTAKVPWSLDSVEQQLLAVINRTIEDAPGSHPRIAELLRRLADEVDEATRPELRDAVWIAREELDLHDAEPGGFRIFQGATVIASCKSTHRPWYRDLTTSKPGVTALRRKQIEARLDDIEVGKLPTKRTTNTHMAVAIAIKDLPRTSPLRGGP